MLFILIIFALSFDCIQKWYLILIYSILFLFYFLIVLLSIFILIAFWTKKTNMLSLLGFEFDNPGSRVVLSVREINKWENSIWKFEKRERQHALSRRRHHHDRKSQSFRIAATNTKKQQQQQQKQQQKRHHKKSLKEYDNTELFAKQIILFFI